LTLIQGASANAESSASRAMHFLMLANARVQRRHADTL
jgi:hypothetical protein